MDSVNSNYLKSTIEDINFEILFYPTVDVFSNPTLPRTGKIIEQCWTYINNEHLDDGNFEKVSVSPKDFKPKSGIKKFNFPLLEQTLNFKDLELDMKELVLDLESSFIQEIDEKLLNLSTDLQIKHFLNCNIEALKSSQISLANLKTNKTQSVLKELLINSYKNTYQHLKSKYSEYMPESNDTSFDSTEDALLKNYIYSDELKKFKEVEERLIETDWLIHKDLIRTWNKSKTDLIDFCRFISEQEMYRQNIKLTKFIKFIEDRYNLKTDTLKKPSKFKKRPLKRYNFDFLFD